MAATLLSRTLSFHAEVQRHQSQVKHSSELSAGGKMNIGAVVVTSTCPPFFLSVDNFIARHTRTALLHGSCNRVQRSVRVASLKDRQRQVFHPVDELLKPVELPSPTPPNENGIGKGEETEHTSESPKRVVDFLTSKPDENGFSLEEANKAEEDLPGTIASTVIATVTLLAVVGTFGALGVVYKEQINDILTQFSDFLEGHGPAGYALFVIAYAVLEVLAIPAIPLTMSAGLLFGTLYGTILVSISGTLAATAAFLIARYFARDRILKLAQNNPKFLAIDKAVGADSFRVVTLLRLSPLLPFSLGNYLYGLTSIELGPYVLGSWLGMLPGTWAYVSAGSFERAFIKQELEAAFPEGPESYWTLGLGLVATIFAALYVGKLAKEAMKDIEGA